jgi:hypothetical protein
MDRDLVATSAQRPPVKEANDTSPKSSLVWPRSAARDLGGRDRGEGFR